jgi:phospholipid/cholesterol/gamma-HCH transport system substrate-binding protein
MNGEIREILVGSIALVVLVAVAVVSFMRSEIADGGTYDIKASFARIDGLVAGNEVRMGGIKIGTVAGEELTETFRAALTLRLASSVKLPRDTSAAIHTDGLFGSKYIELEPGGDMESIQPGGSITMTQDSVVVEDLLDLIIGEAKSKRAAEASSSESN